MAIDHRLLFILGITLLIPGTLQSCSDVAGASCPDDNTCCAGGDDLTYSCYSGDWNCCDVGSDDLPAACESGYTCIKNGDEWQCLSNVGLAFIIIGGIATCACCVGLCIWCYRKSKRDREQRNRLQAQLYQQNQQQAVVVGAVATTGYPNQMNQGGYPNQVNQSGYQMNQSGYPNQGQGQGQFVQNPQGNQTGYAPQGNSGYPNLDGNAQNANYDQMNQNRA
mmetsp:Transcript_55331/g.63255  ORF Transcript_55331/g.63255 Transcript_55331/m.63255 type:complete len:222 (-) Transcript_55331:260-925(-)